MQNRELAWLDIDGITHAIESGDQTARSITDVFLERIEKLDPELQAFSVVWPERARERADLLDRARKAGEPLGALHGVAIALKDLCDVAGEPTRAGTTALGETPASENAEVVDRLEAAGAVILGKVKMTEGAFVSHHPTIAPPVNPWNAGRWTGISSSGSGVAVAAGLCTAALGTDTGGSIRYPSAACGLTGLKPTHGRVSLRGVFPLADSLDHIGPMARSAADATRVFAVLAGHDPDDPWSLASNPAVGSTSALAPNLRGLRIGVDPSFNEDQVDAAVVENTRAVIEVYREAGAEIVQVKLPAIEEAIGAWVSLAAAEIANAHADTYPSKADQYGEDLKTTIEFGRTVDGRTVAHAWKNRIALSRRLEAVFDTVDVLLAPVIPGLFAANTNLSDVAANPLVAQATRFTSPFNLSGTPSLTMCGGFDVEGAPIGFQILGPHRDEARLLALGMAYQSATDWHLCHPQQAD